MPYSGPVPVLGGGRLKAWANPWQTWRRRRSDAAMVSDFAALRKPLLLCATCEARMPRRWTERYGYRLLHNMHTEGHCDYCRTYQAANLYHHVEGGYCQDWARTAAIQDAARQQQLAIRDKRRIKGM